MYACTILYMHAWTSYLYQSVALHGLVGFFLLIHSLKWLKSCWCASRDSRLSSSDTKDCKHTCTHAHKKAYGMFTLTHKLVTTKLFSQPKPRTILANYTSRTRLAPQHKITKNVDPTKAHIYSHTFYTCYTSFISVFPVVQLSQRKITGSCFDKDTHIHTHTHKYTHFTVSPVVRPSLKAPPCRARCLWRVVTCSIARMASQAWHLQALQLQVWVQPFVQRKNLSR